MSTGTREIVRQVDLFGDETPYDPAPPARELPAPPRPAPVPCDACGRRLTTPESVGRGRGPICDGRTPTGYPPRAPGLF